MKKYLLFLLSVFTVKHASSQCSYNIYPQNIQITATQTLTAQNAYYWVCENVVLTIDSSWAGTFYMEQNSKIIFAKASMSCDAVYAKSSCTVINTSAGCVGITANPANVTVQNTGTGSAAIGFTCPAVNYVYNGVSGPCISTGIKEISAAAGLLIYPNPVFTNEILYFDNNDAANEITLHDMNGKLVQKKPANKNEIKLQNVSCGFYMIKIKGRNSETWRKLMVID